METLSIDPQDMNAEDLVFKTLEMLINRHKLGKPLSYGVWETAERNLKLANAKRVK